MTANIATGQAPPPRPRDPHGPGSALHSDAAFGTLGAVGGVCLSGLASILIARQLGVTARGRWAVISSLAVLAATIASTGLPIAAAYAAARLKSTERSRIVQASLAAAVVFALLAALLYLVLAGLLKPPASTAAVVVGCAIPAATVCYSVSHQLTLTVASMRWFAAAQLANAAVTLAAVIALGLTVGLNVFAVVIISAGGSVVGASVSVIALRRNDLFHTRLVTGPVMTARALRPYLSYAMITFGTLSLTTIVQRVDVLLVNGFKGPYAAGLYAVAVQVSDLLLVVPAALGLVMFRRGARAVPDHYSEVVSVLRWTGAFAVAAALVALATAGWLIPLVFGSHYRGSVEPLRLLLPGTVAFSLQSVLSNYLAGRGRPRIVLFAWLAGAVVGIGADLLVIPAYGIAGAAVVSSLSYMLVTGLHFKALRGVRPQVAVGT